MRQLHLRVIDDPVFIDIDLGLPLVYGLDGLLGNTIDDKMVVAAQREPVKREGHLVLTNDVLQHLTALCEAVDLQVNADFESGFATEPQGVASNVSLAIMTGVAGVSIEDRDM